MRKNKLNTNIIALRTHYTDGSTYLFSENSYKVGDTETELFAMVLSALEAKEHFESDRVQGVDMCWCNAAWNFEAEEDTVYKEIPLTVKKCDALINSFDIYAYLPEIEGKTLEVLPDACYNSALRKKVNKIRKVGGCTDWKKQNRALEWDNNSWWYLHGELESKVHFDKAIIINATEAGVTRETVRWYSISGNKCNSYDDTPLRAMHLDGIRHCKVIGVNADCLGFFYTDREKTVYYDKGTFNYWEQRGYVVQKNDPVAVLQAYHKYLMKDLH